MRQCLSQTDPQDLKWTIGLEDLSLYPDVEDWSTLVQQIVELRALIADTRTAEDEEAAQMAVVLDNLLNHKTTIAKITPSRLRERWTTTASALGTKAHGAGACAMRK
ncbi:MAG: hypothetical protein ACREYC_00605 [Gammaproteobacteria bacterium]